MRKQYAIRGQAMNRRWAQHGESMDKPWANQLRPTVLCETPVEAQFNHEQIMGLLVHSSWAAHSRYMSDVWVHDKRRIDIRPLWMNCYEHCYEERRATSDE